MRTRKSMICGVNRTSKQTQTIFELTRNTSQDSFSFFVHTQQDTRHNTQHNIDYYFSFYKLSIIEENKLFVHMQQHCM
jgi:hypothetical protein